MSFVGAYSHPKAQACKDQKAKEVLGKGGHYDERADLKQVLAH